MKEIEFRAWLKNEKKMVEVEEINFIYEVIRFKDYKNPFTEPIERTVSFKDIELIQCTGFKDKYNVKIFDSYIVKITIKDKITIAEVKWSEKRCKFIFVCGEDTIGLEYFQINSELEVIGNIYENPELLKRY